MKRRLTLWFLLFAALLTVLTVAVSADNTRLLSYVSHGYSEPEPGIFLPAELSEGKGLSLPLTETNYYVGGPYTRARLRNDDAVFPRPVLWTYLSPDGGSDTVTYSIDFTDREVDLSEFSVLEFGMYIAGKADYTVSVTILTQRGFATASAEIRSGSWNLLSVEISELSSYLHSMTVSVQLPSNAYPSAIRLIGPSVLYDLPVQFSNIRRFGAPDFICLNGSYDAGLILPDENGNATLSAELHPDYRPLSGKPSYIELQLENVGIGSVSVGLLDNKTGRSTFLPAVSLKNGVLLLPLTSAGTMSAYVLQFTRVSPETGFDLKSVRFLSDSGSYPSGDPSIGSVKSITLNGNVLHFSGIAERSVFTEYHGAELVFFALPAYETDRLENAMEIGSTRLSTVFEYTVDLTPYPLNVSCQLFFAALKTEDGKIIPLSAPRYPDADHFEENSLSVTGLADAASIGCFESNIDQVIIDIPLDDLLLASSGTGASVSYSVYTSRGTDNRLLSFDRSLLSSLDRDISFYETAGIRVYLRLTAIESITGLTYGGYLSDNHAIRLSGNENFSEYVAIVRFLARRYPGTAGFVLGLAANDFSCIGTDEISDLPAYVSELADWCRITYNAASGSMRTPLILVPVNVSDTADIDAQSLLLMLLSRLGTVGTVPWGPLWCTDSLEDSTLIVPGRYAHLLSQFDLPSPSAQMILSSPSWIEMESRLDPASGDSFTDYVAESFGAFWDMCSQQGYDAAFLSLGQFPYINDHDFYTKLKSAARSGGSESDFSADILPDASGTPVWDFSDAYHPLGWVAGSGVAFCATDVSQSDPAASERVLRTTYDQGTEGSGIAGIILRDLKNAANLSQIDRLDFTLSLADPASISDPDVSLVIVVGANDRRAEYYADKLPVGSIFSLSCDLTQYEYRSGVDFVGIMLYADSPVELELHRVSASSGQLRTEEIPSKFQPDEIAEESAEVLTNYTVIAAVVLLAAVISAVLFAAMMKKDKENKNELSAAGKTADHTRRNSYH